MKCFDEFGDPCLPAKLQGCYFNVSGGGGQSASSPVTNPEVFNLLKSNVSNAQNIASTPFQSYGGQMTAGMTPTQQQAGSMLTSGAANAGAGAINSGINAAQSATGSAAPGMAAYQNPYTDQVVNSTLGDIERQRQMAINQGGADATQAHAFGGARQGVADSLTNEAYGRTAASTAAGLRSQGFDTSAGLAQNDASRNLQAGGILGQLGNSQASNFLNASNAINSYGGQEQQTNQSMLTAAYNEFMRQVGYAPQMQQLVSQAMGLVPGSIGQGSKQSSWNAGFGLG